MKTFSQHVNESVIRVPEFNHQDLNNNTDKDDKFWSLINTMNDPDNDMPRQVLDKIIKSVKDAYSALSMYGGEYQELATCFADALKELNKKAQKTVDTSFTSTEVKSIQTYLSCVQAIDSMLSSYGWYKTAKVSIKAGYIPFRGTSKDPKIKFRIIVRKDDKFPQSAIPVIKKIQNINPITADYVAGVEIDKDMTAFQILLTNAPGYKR